MTSQPYKKGGRHAAPRVRNERLRMVIMIILAVIMSLIATVCVLYRVWVQRPDLPPVGGESIPPTSQNSGDPSVSDEPDLPDYDPVQPKVNGERKSKDFYTFFVFGADESSNLTDTMMVVSYDVTNQKATVMSIPRDMITNSNGHGVDAKKINAVYARSGGGDRGITNLKNEVSELVGFTPDYYVKIDWEIVGQMVDAIGGVYFDVPRDMWYVDPYQDLYIDLKAGHQKLNGDQAMQLVRWRKNMDPNTYKVIFAVGDVERLQLQHSFLRAVLSQVLQFKNLTKISELAEVFGKNVASDLSIENMFWFGSQAIIGGLSIDSVEFVTMPFAYGTYPIKQSDGSYMDRSFVYPAQNSLLKLINEKLNPFVTNVTLRELDLVYVNSAGGLSTTSGVLSDPSMALPPVEESQYPSDDPNGSDNPNSSDPPNPDVTDDPSGGAGSGSTDEMGPFWPPASDPSPTVSESVPSYEPPSDFELDLWQKPI